MAKFTKDAQETINRLKAINYDEPYWNEKEVIKCFERQYEILGVKMPEVQVADNMLIGFEIALGAARGAAWGAARDAARDAARGAAWDAARGAAWDAAWGAAWDAALDAARGAARDAALDAARGAARDAAWGAALRNTGLKDSATLKFIEVTTQDLKALENGLGFYFPMRDKLILVPMPRMIMNDQILHYDHGKAVEWKDGT